MADRRRCWHGASRSASLRFRCNESQASMARLFEKISFKESGEICWLFVVVVVVVVGGGGGAGFAAGSVGLQPMGASYASERERAAAKSSTPRRGSTFSPPPATTFHRNYSAASRDCVTVGFSPRFTEFNRVLPRFPGLDWVIPGITGFS